MIPIKDLANSKLEQKPEKCTPFSIHSIDNQFWSILNQGKYKKKHKHPVSCLLMLFYTNYQLTESDSGHWCHLLLFSTKIPAQWTAESTPTIRYGTPSRVESVYAKRGRCFVRTWCVRMWVTARPQRRPRASAAQCVWLTLKLVKAGMWPAHLVYENFLCGCFLVILSQCLLWLQQSDDLAIVVRTAGASVSSPSQPEASRLQAPSCAHDLELFILFLKYHVRSFPLTVFSVFKKEYIEFLLDKITSQLNFVQQKTLVASFDSHFGK